MERSNHRRVTVIALCICSLLLNEARADSLQNDARWILAGTAGTGVALGIGVYYAVHHQVSIRGCVGSGPNGLEIRNESDHLTYALLGVTNDVKAGERLRLTGKRQKTGKAAPGDPAFLVEKVSKDYGGCEVAAGR